MTRNLKYIKYKSGVSSNKKDIIGILNEDCWEDLEHYVREHELDWDEAIDVITKEYTIEKEKIGDYLKEDAVRIRIKGQNEDSGLVPSIKVGGKVNAAN